MSDEQLCRKAYDDFYHKIKAEVGYDHWVSIWNFIQKRRGEPVAYMRIIPYDDEGNFQRDLIDADKVGDLSSYKDFVTFIPLYEAPQPAKPVKVPSKNEIRAIMLKHGYTIKPGHDDLKPYVYAAARELIALAQGREP